MEKEEISRQMTGQEEKSSKLQLVLCRCLVMLKGQQQLTCSVLKYKGAFLCHLSSACITMTQLCSPGSQPALKFCL